MDRAAFDADTRRLLAEVRAGGGLEPPLEPEPEAPLEAPLEPTLDQLAAEVAALHADATEAARVARVCATVAGMRLNAIRESMRKPDWIKWVKSSACPVPARVLARYLEAAETAEREAEAAGEG